MIIKQDPITGLWCREDGAALMPPCKHSRFKKFRWTFGYPLGKDGYLAVWRHGKPHCVHRIMARAFIPNPDSLPTIDHIDRCPSNNRIDNLRWADYKMQAENGGMAINRTDYGIRACEDINAYMKVYNAAHHKAKKAYNTAYNAAHREERNAYRAARYAAQKAKGLVKRKGPDGKWRWISGT